MAHAPEAKREARRLYVIERLALPAIETAIGVKASTVSRWKREAKTAGDDWQLAREAHLIAGQGLDAIMAATAERYVAVATKALAAIERAIDACGEDEFADPEALVKSLTALSDGMAKMTASAGRLAPRISQLGVAQDVLRRLADFVERRFPEHGEAFVEILEPFGAELSEAFG